MYNLTFIKIYIIYNIFYWFWDKYWNVLSNIRKRLYCVNFIPSEVDQYMIQRICKGINYSTDLFSKVKLIYQIIYTFFILKKKPQINFYSRFCIAIGWKPLDSIMTNVNHKLNKCFTKNHSALFVGIFTTMRGTKKVYRSIALKLCSVIKESIILHVLTT